MAKVIGSDVEVDVTDDGNVFVSVLGRRKSLTEVRMTSRQARKLAIRILQVADHAERRLDRPLRPSRAE
jgi:hypothetical protein